MGLAHRAEARLSCTNEMRGLAPPGDALAQLAYGMGRLNCKSKKSYCALQHHSDIVQRGFTTTLLEGLQLTSS
jgi:hypothetical protein